MFLHALLLALIFAVAVASWPLQLEAQWQEFKLTHGKTYRNQEEENLRFGVFRENLKRIESHNKLYEAGDSTFKMGITQFADLTDEDFKKYLTLSGENPFPKDVEVYADSDISDLPKNIDYREKNAVTPIKNQKWCGSCWAFSTVGSLESLNFLKTGQLMNLSAQNLVDCTLSYGNIGCAGGLTTSSYEYIKDNGIEKDDDYPYTAFCSPCEYQKSKVVVNTKGYTMVQNGSESALQSAIANVGPIAVSVDATGWGLYVSGIFEIDTFESLNHAVVAVGYGEENGSEYYIIKNSWDTVWGEDGYMRLARNKNNQCGIASGACYANL